MFVGRRGIRSSNQVTGNGTAVFRRVTQMRESAGVSRYWLSRAAHVDERYLARLEAGEAKNPGRAVLMRVGRELVAYSSRFTRSDADQLLEEAGYLPSPDWLWESPVEEFGIFDSHASAYGRWLR